MTTMIVPSDANAYVDELAAVMQKVAQTLENHYLNTELPYTVELIHESDREKMYFLFKLFHQFAHSINREDVEFLMDLYDYFRSLVLGLKKRSCDASNNDKLEFFRLLICALKECRH